MEKRYREDLDQSVAELDKAVAQNDSLAARINDAVSTATRLTEVNKQLEKELEARRGEAAAVRLQGARGLARARGRPGPRGLGEVMGRAKPDRRPDSRGLLFGQATYFFEQRGPKNVESCSSRLPVCLAWRLVRPCKYPSFGRIAGCQVPAQALRPSPPLQTIVRPRAGVASSVWSIQREA